MPGGKTLRVVAQPHPFGGLTFLYEDVTEKLALESSYNTLIKVQTATLDTLQEGVAVFGPDGRLKLYNAAFARIWELDDKDLAEGDRMSARGGGLRRAIRRRGGVGQAGRDIASGAERRARMGRDRAQRPDHFVAVAGAAARRRDAASPLPTSPTASASKARCATATKRWKPPTS